MAGFGIWHKCVVDALAVSGNDLYVGGLLRRQVG